MNLETLDSEVQRLADEATPDLLPMLLKIFMSDDRPGLMTCERHMKNLFPYIRAQISLTRAKRRYYSDWSTEHIESLYGIALSNRDEIRRLYRSTPCTCWVQHR